MTSGKLSDINKKKELVKEFYRAKLWYIYMSDEDKTFSELIKTDEIFKEIAAPIIALEKKRPAYIPKKFYKNVLWQIHTLEKYAVNQKEKNNQDNDIINNMNLDKVCYLQNLISYDDDRLKEFYTYAYDNNELLSAILYLFLYLPDWHYDYKTSGKVDSSIANKLENKFRECAALLTESPDLQINTQFFWEGYIRKIIDNSCKDNATEIGKKIKLNAKRMIFPNFSNNTKLLEDGIIEDTNIVFSQYIQIAHIMLELSNYMAAIAPKVENKTSLVKKNNAKDAHIHYAAKKIKQIFTEHSVAKKKHIKFITDIINAVIGTEYSEENARKLLNTKKL